MKLNKKKNLNQEGWSGKEVSPAEWRLRAVDPADRFRRLGELSSGSGSGSGSGPVLLLLQQHHHSVLVSAGRRIHLTLAWELMVVVVVVDQGLGLVDQELVDQELVLVTRVSGIWVVV